MQRSKRYFGGACQPLHDLTDAEIDTLLGDRRAVQAREEAKEIEKKRIEAIPAHETLPGGWVSFCKIMSDNIARGLYSDATR
jgi:hypothetical protein